MSHKVININKVIREITHKWSNYKGDFHKYYVDGYYDAQRDCIQIIKDNIQEKPNNLLEKYNDNEYIQRYSKKTDR